MLSGQTARVNVKIICRIAIFMFYFGIKATTISGFVNKWYRA